MKHEEILQHLLVSVRKDIDLPNARLSPGFYYSSLALCTIDAAFSVNVRYESVVNTVHRFVHQVGWPAVYRTFGSDYPAKGQEKTITDLLKEYGNLADPDQAAELLFGNLGVSNPASKKPIRKAQLVRLMAEVLVGHGINSFADYRAYPEPEDLDAALRALPSLSSGVVTNYLRMLAGGEGGDNSAKPDRMLKRYVRHACGDSMLPLSNEEITRLFQDAARILSADEGLGHITVRLLDHEVWKVQRNRETPLVGNKAKAVPALYRRRVPGPQGQVAPGARIREDISMDEFWTFCEQGGHTPSGLEFGVDAQDRLHIRSANAANQAYKISRKTVASYLGKARDSAFRQGHGWFSRVFDMAIASLSEQAAPQP